MGLTPDGSQAQRGRQLCRRHPGLHPRAAARAPRRHVLLGYPRCANVGRLQ